MGLMVGGVAVAIATAAAFWAALPRNGRCHRFVGTEFEPYVGVLFTAAIALSFALILSGAINVFG